MEVFERREGEVQIIVRYTPRAITINVNAEIDVSSQLRVYIKLELSDGLDVKQLHVGDEMFDYVAGLQQEVNLAVVDGTEFSINLTTGIGKAQA